MQATERGPRASFGMRHSLRSFPPSASSDRELMRQVVAGDDGAFRRMYRRQAPLLFSVIFHILKDHAEAEDVLQETFVQMWRNAARYDADRGSVSTWSVMIARHKAIDKARSRQRYSLATLAAGVEILREEERDRVKQAMSRIGGPHAKRSCWRFLAVSRTAKLRSAWVRRSARSRRASVVVCVPYETPWQRRGDRRE